MGIEETELDKFEDFTIESSKEVWWSTTVELECKWNGKKFTVRDYEDSNGREFFWGDGEYQFTEKE